MEIDAQTYRDIHTYPLWRASDREGKGEKRTLAHTPHKNTYTHTNTNTQTNLSAISRPQAVISTFPVAVMARWLTLFVRQSTNWRKRIKRNCFLWSDYDQSGVLSVGIQTLTLRQPLPFVVLSTVDVWFGSWSCFHTALIARSLVEVLGVEVGFRRIHGLVSNQILIECVDILMVNIAQR